MVYSEPKLTEIDGFTVAGLSVRTINSDEFNPNMAKLPAFWGGFLSSGISEKIPNRLHDSSIYGVYSQYASDANDYYTVTAGVQITDKNNQLDYDVVEIQQGTYLVFEARGKIPEVLIQTWGRIWDYFNHCTNYERCFNTDFEVYLGPEQIAVYIGVTS